MIGDLAIAPGLDLARGASPAKSATGPRSEAQGTSLRRPGQGAPGPDAVADLAEAERLKALFTDPGVQVSTHRDDDSGRVVMRVEDRHTGDLVEQIPPDKLLRLYAALRDTLVDERA